VNKVLNEEVIEHEKEHCGKRRSSERGRGGGGGGGERWVKETRQLKIERKYPTMKMVFGEFL